MPQVPNGQLMEVNERLGCAAGRKVRAGLEVLSDGDQGVFAYAGHGSRTGLLGVDGQECAHTDISSAIHEAMGKGAHVDAFVDACHSGNLADQLLGELEPSSITHEFYEDISYDQAKLLHPEGKETIWQDRVEKGKDLAPF